MLEFYWDNKAQLLLVAPEQPGDFDLVLVELRSRSGAREVLGHGSLGDSPTDILAFRLPDVDQDEPLRLMVQAFPSRDRAREVNSFSRNLRLAPGSPSERGDTKLWVICRYVDYLGLSIFDQSEVAPPDVVSNVWASAMEGDMLFPAVPRVGSGLLPTAQLQVDYERDDTGHAILPARFKLDFDQVDGNTTPAEARLHIYTLSANGDVLPLLGDVDGHIPARSNYLEKELKQGQPVTIYVPDLPEARESPLNEDFEMDRDALQTIAYLDYLDRLVIDSYPPLSFEMRIAGGRPQKLTNAGQVVLVYATNGRLVEDEGALVEKLYGRLEEKAPETVFTIQMQEHGHVLSRSDLTAASEPVLWLYSEVLGSIEAHYNAAAANLKPFDFEEYLSAPGYFGLLSSGKPQEYLSELTRKLGELSSEATEVDRVGYLLGVSLLSASEREVSKAPAHKRLEHWTTCKITEGKGWALVPAAMRSDVRRGLAAGLAWHGSDLGGFIYFLSQPHAEAMISELREVRDELTKVGVLPMTMQAQFTDYGGARARLGELRHLRDEVYEFIQQVEHELQLQAAGARPLCLNNIQDLAASEEFLVRGFFRTVEALFNSKIEKMSHDFVAEGLELDLNKLNKTLARFFMRSVRHDIELITGIVQSGYENPIEDNVVDLQTAADPASMYRRPLTAEQQTWLFEEQGEGPPLVEIWRERLRKSYENYNAATKSSGPAE